MASYRYERNISPEDLVPEKTRELTPAEARANWWHYHWYYVVLIAAAVFCVEPCHRGEAGLYGSGRGAY